MDQDVVLTPAYDAGASERSAFLRAVAWRTLGGLAVTALVSIASMIFIAPTVFGWGTWGVLGVVYGSFLLSQTLVRGIVYGPSKAAGFLIGTSLQGVALGFLLTITLALGKVDDGLTVIGYALAMTLLAALAMTVYVTIEKHEFSLLRAGLGMLFVPMLILMGLQLVFPIGGAMGMVIAVVFLAVSVGALLWKLNYVVHELPVTMPTEGAYELTLGIVVMFWNLLSLLNRGRRR
jgi:FtsH-binding integral membrane protein